MSDLALFGRVALAALFGYVIGWEREVRGQPAGDRTFALVAAGSAAFTVIAVDSFPSTAEKMLAGVITGIGFLGAGLVLHTKEGEARGLTTAAAVWAVAAVGIVAGAGRPVLAGAITALVLLVLELRNIPLLRLLDSRRWVDRTGNDDDPPAPRWHPLAPKAGSGRRSR